MGLSISFFICCLSARPCASAWRPHGWEVPWATPGPCGSACRLDSPASCSSAFPGGSIALGDQVNTSCPQPPWAAAPCGFLRLPLAPRCCGRGLRTHRSWRAATQHSEESLGVKAPHAGATRQARSPHSGTRRAEGAWAVEAACSRSKGPAPLPPALPSPCGTPCLHRGVRSRWTATSRGWELSVLVPGGLAGECARCPSPRVPAPIMPGRGSHPRPHVPPCAFTLCPTGARHMGG